MQLPVLYSGELLDSPILFDGISKFNNTKTKTKIHKEQIMKALVDSKSIDLHLRITSDNAVLGGIRILPTSKSIKLCGNIGFSVINSYDNFSKQGFLILNTGFEY